MEYVWQGILRKMSISLLNVQRMKFYHSIKVDFLMKMGVKYRCTLLMIHRKSVM